MRVQVELAICDKHGQCIAAAPGIFRFDEEGELVYRAEVPEAEVPAAEEAELLCPVQAITLVR